MGAKRGTPLQAFVAIVANGTLSPLYATSPRTVPYSLETKDRSINFLAPGVYRRGEEGMIECVEFLAETKFWKRGDVCST